MNDPRPYFPFHVADFWGSINVELMSMEAVGLYLAMLSREWQQGSLPADATALRRLYGGRCSAWDESFAAVRACFVERDGRLYNARLEHERELADRFSMRQSGAAKARWEAWKATRDATAMPRHSGGNAAGMPMTGQDRTGQSPPTPPSGGAAASAKFTPTWPAHLDTPEVRAAWAEWESYRRERKQKAYGPVGFARAIKPYATPQQFVAAVEASIAGNWQGIHPAKNGASPRPVTSTTPKPAYTPF